MCACINCIWSHSSCAPFFVSIFEWFYLSVAWNKWIREKSGYMWKQRNVCVCVCVCECWHTCVCAVCVLYLRPIHHGLHLTRHKRKSKLYISSTQSPCSQNMLYYSICKHITAHFSTTHITILPHITYTAHSIQHTERSWTESTAKAKFCANNFNVKVFHLVKSEHRWNANKQN